MAAVLISETFESGVLLQSQGGQWLDAPAANIVTTEQVHAGTRALKYDPSFSTTTGLYRTVTATQILYIDMYWFFPTNFQYGPNGAPGRHTLRASNFVGDNVFANYLDTGIKGTGGMWGVEWNWSGPDTHSYLDLFTFPQNQWSRLELLLTLNDVGQFNGSTKIWLNGVSVLDATGDQYRTNNTLFTLFAATSNFDGPFTGDPHYWYLDDITVWNDCPATGASCSPTQTITRCKSIRLY